MVEVKNGMVKTAERVVSEATYKKLLEMAKNMGFLPEHKENFDTHNSDSEDFFETSVWTANAAMQTFYKKGYEDATAKITKGLRKLGLDTGARAKAGKTADKQFKAANAQEAAKILWEKLKKAFNDEAAEYGQEDFKSELGSIGDKSDREVCRSFWWDYVNGDDYGDYDEVTGIIEREHDGEQLETGRITFGS